MRPVLMPRTVRAAGAVCGICRAIICDWAMTQHLIIEGMRSSGMEVGNRKLFRLPLDDQVGGLAHVKRAENRLGQRVTGECGTSDLVPSGPDMPIASMHPFGLTAAPRT